MFLKIDLRSRYHQVCIKDDDIYNIGFWTGMGIMSFL